MEQTALPEQYLNLKTRRTYESSWRRFVAFCVAVGRPALPASAETVGLHLRQLARDGRAMCTISRAVRSIAVRHRALCQASPLTGDVRRVVEELRHQLGQERQRRKRAPTVGDLRDLVVACGGSALGLRDRTMLLLSFASPLRGKELAALDVEDVSFHRRTMRLRLPSGSTPVRPGLLPLTCPVRTMQAWLRARGTAAGPLFCDFEYADGRLTYHRLTGEMIADMAEAAATQSGVNGLPHQL